MVELELLEKALQMEREIASHLMVDDTQPQIWKELLEAFSYTNGLIQAMKDTQRHCSTCRTPTDGARLEDGSW